MALKSSVARVLPLWAVNAIRRLRSQRKRELERAHFRAVEELETVLCGTLFRSLPPRAGRTELLARLIGTTPTQAMYLLAALHDSLAVPGDVCELGVAQGATSALLANELLDSDRALWLYDSFRGLPAPTAQDVLIDDIFSLGDIKR